MKQLGFNEDPKKRAQFPVTPEPEAEPRHCQVDTAKWTLPSTTCSGARQHLKSTMLQDIPAPSTAQSPGLRSYMCGTVQGPWL